MERVGARSYLFRRGLGFGKGRISLPREGIECRGTASSIPVIREGAVAPAIEEALTSLGDLPRIIEVEASLPPSCLGAGAVVRPSVIPPWEGTSPTGAHSVDEAIYMG